MKILVFVESGGSAVRPAGRSAITLARRVAEAMNAEIEIVLFGHQLDAVARDAARYAPTFTVDDVSLAHPTADRYAEAMSRMVRERNADCFMAASTVQGKDCLARAAGLLGGVMISDAVDCDLRDGRLVWRRIVHAGAVAA